MSCTFARKKKFFFFKGLYILTFFKGGHFYITLVEVFNSLRGLVIWFEIVLKLDGNVLDFL